MNIKTKIVNGAQLKKHIVSHRRSGKTIAFTNGCFDILHYGHVSYLEKAKKNNRILIVGLNSDASVRKIKGPKRPIVSEKERAFVVAALACVDYVTIFREDTPEELIAYLQPDILIKGADWKGKEVAGSRSVKRRGGHVEYIKYINNFSTTNIIEKIAQTCKK